MRLRSILIAVLTGTYLQLCLSCHAPASGNPTYPARIPIQCRDPYSISSLWFVDEDEQNANQSQTNTENQQPQTTPNYSTRRTPSVMSSDPGDDGLRGVEDASPGFVESRQNPPGRRIPTLVRKKTEIKIMERIEFDTASATIRPEYDGVLSTIVYILKTYPDIKRLSLEGHSDNRESAAGNMALSNNRAASVKNWLIARGVDRSRLISQGFGRTKPIDSSNTDAGRQINRRVEFHIIEQAP